MSRAELNMLRELKIARSGGDQRAELNALRGLKSLKEDAPAIEVSSKKDQQIGITDKILEVVEPTIALTTGAGAQVVGGLAGIGQSLNPFAEEGAGAKISKEIQEAGTFQPRTEAGQQGLENTLDTLQPIADFIDKFRTGDETLESGGGPLLATINEIAPEILGAIVGVKGVGAKPPPQVKVKPSGKLEPALDKTGQIKSKLVNKVDDAETAGFKLEKGNVVEDKLATSTIKQGFGEDVVAMVKGSSKQDKSNMMKMVDITRKRKKNARYGVNNRPSDIAGDVLLERVKHVKSVNINSGKLLDRVAKTLKGKQADFGEPVSNFIQKLDDMGITIEDGKPIFTGSDIDGLPAPQKAIRGMLKRINNIGEAPDAFQMHRVKKFIDEQVDFGKSAGGLTGKTESILKGLRKDIDTSLDSTFPKYDKVNTTFSETKQALDALQEVAGKKMKLTEAGGNSAIGTLLRRLMGNAQSRVTLDNAIDIMDTTARKYGGKFNSDPKILSIFATEIDKVFGPQTKTSFKSEIGESITRGVEGLSAGPAVQGTGRAIIKKAQGINEANAFEAIETLLNRTQ